MLQDLQYVESRHMSYAKWNEKVGGNEIGTGWNTKHPTLFSAMLW